MCVKKFTQISENAGKFYTQRLETSSLSVCIDKQHKDGVQCWQESPKLFTLLFVNVYRMFSRLTPGPRSQI